MDVAAKIITALALFCSITELGMSIYMFDYLKKAFDEAVREEYGKDVHIDFKSPTQLNFLLFCGAFSIVVLAGSALYSIWRGPSAVPVFFFGAAAIFWFCGSIAWAVFWGQLDKLECRGVAACNVLKAMVAFGIICFGLFLALVGIELPKGVKARQGLTSAV